MNNMATYIRKTGIALAVAFLLLAATVVASGLGTQQAFAENTTLVMSEEIPDYKVSDDVTRFNVSKLAKDDHTYVEGAKLQILDENNNVVYEWTSGKSAEKIDKILNVGKKYILREVSAPDGFDKVKDTVFTIPASEEEGIKIISKPDDVEQTDKFSVALYDTRLATEKVVTEHKSRISGTTAPKTGDETPYELLAAIGIACIAGIVVLQVIKTRKNKVGEQRK